MKHSITQSYSWLHTWAGLVFGWALVAIFLTGTLAVFDREITQWMQPEIPTGNVSRTQAVDTANHYLRQHHPTQERWAVQLPTERSDRLAVSVGEARRGGGQTILDPATGQELAVRETAGGNFFFRFHYTLNLPRNLGIWVVGLMAMAMLAAIVTGIVIHKKFFKEFFTFRPNKGQRSWLDYHNASGVLLLPFHIMITYTGLVIFFMIYMPAPVDALFNGDRQAYVSELRGTGPGGESRGEPGRGRGAPPAPMPFIDRTAQIDFAGLIAQAEARMGPIAGFSLQRRADGQAIFEASPVLGNVIELTKGRSMAIDALSGRVVREPAASSGASWVQRVMAGLHFAQFGGYPMRWLYFICGLISTAMMAGGLVLFCVKRRRRYAKESPRIRLGYELIERINIAVIIGLPLACVGLLWANRLLPVELSGRASSEITLFFTVWGASFVHAALRPWVSAWREQLWIGAALCLGLPLSNVLAGQPLWGANQNLYVELTTLALGGLIALAAIKVSRPASEAVSRTGKLSKETLA